MPREKSYQQKDRRQKNKKCIDKEENELSIAKKQIKNIILKTSRKHE